MPISFNPLVVEANFRYTFNDEDMENIIWLEYGGGGTPAPIVFPALASLLFNWWEDNLKPLQSITCTLREIYLRQAVDDPAIEYTLSGDATSVGTATGDALPGNVSLVVSFRTGLSGRSFRGRNYSLGMVEPQQAGGQVTTAYFNALKAAYEDLLVDLAASSDFVWVVYSQVADGAVRATGLPTSVQSVVIVDNNTDSQRRRNRGVGS